MAPKHNENKDDETGSGGSAGASGIEFHDFITGSSASRDDNMPPDEQRRLLAAHRLAHELLVKKQKEIRDQRKDLKEGKKSLQDYRRESAAKMESNYKPHPLSYTAQFSGIDKQNNPVPTEAELQTNDENRNELEHEYRLTHQPEMGKKFNPKPQFP